MEPLRDVQALSDADIHVYEAVAGAAVEHGSVGMGELVHSTGLPGEEVRESLERLIGRGYVRRAGEGFGLGPHTFGVER
jgi:DNA-binding IclR family transcriptional regulator